MTELEAVISNQSSEPLAGWWPLDKAQNAFPILLFHLFLQML